MTCCYQVFIAFYVQPEKYMDGFDLNFLQIYLQLKTPEKYKHCYPGHIAHPAVNNLVFSQIGLSFRRMLNPAARTGNVVLSLTINKLCWQLLTEIVFVQRSFQGLFNW